MNPDSLLKHFDQISEAPDALPRLRRFILDLAVRGKLVQQDANDEPASELLKRIDAKKEKLKKRHIGAAKTLQPIRDSEVPFLLPNTWQWVRIGEIFDYDVGNKTEPKQLPKGAWLLELEDIEKDSGKVIQRLTAGDRSPKSTKSEFQRNDVLYGKLRPYLNKALVADGSGFSTTEIVALRCYGDSSPHFTCLALRRPDFVDYVTRLGQGTKMPRLRTEDANAALFPLPPLAEQLRILAKVVELMALCDELEAAQAKRERRRNRLVAASLHDLNNGASADELRQNASFYMKHLPRLSTRPEHIHQLRQTILNLAVRGKLVPQDPNDKPASELLKAIEGEASRLFKSGKVRTQKSFQPVKDVEGPFALPGTWKWISLLSLGITRTGNTPSKNNPEYFGNYIPFVKPADLKATGINYYGEGISREGLPYARLIPDGSVLMVCIGSSIGKVNRTERDICCNQQINTITPFIAACGGFLSLALRADFFRKLVLDHAGTGTLPIISKGKWEKLPVPLPPLAEQHRIVGKVKELMALCDELEARTNNTTAARRQLLEATLHEALYGQRELNQEAPHAR